ncbi:MAG: DUF3365 domain-containing protein [Nitrospiraceae bacterium]|nr:DUF3365 domain-containing protein [Nitrospiraceae bacterium]
MDITKLSAANPKKMMPLSIILLLLIVLSSLYWQISGLKKQALAIATTKAQGTAILIKAARAWNSQLGGVYGPVSAILQPNPYLLAPDRDIRSDMGHKLTKINPAYMTRQIFDIIREPEHLVMRITSLKPLNPVNAPDDWEIKATISFGIAQYPTHGNTLEKIQEAVDAALYSAKSLGRDRTEIAVIPT